jgi:hypothetical protein
MSIKAKLAAAVQRANETGNKNKKKTPMQPMQAKRPTAVTQNRPTSLVGANKTNASAPAATSAVKTKADYKAQNAASKLESKYAKKSENRSYRQEKSAAKREMKLDKIKSGESKTVAEKVEKGAAVAGTLLGVVEGVKRAFPGKNG